MEALLLQLSGSSSQTPSPPPQSKPGSTCRLISLLSTPASCVAQSPAVIKSPVELPALRGTPSDCRPSVNHPQTSSGILKDVVAFVDVRTEADNRSRAIESILRQLGATVAAKLSKDLTHVVFKDGKKRSRDFALKHKLHLVSVSWLMRCKELGFHVDEKEFPVAPPQQSGTPLPYGRLKRYRSMQPKSLEELEVDSAKKLARRRARAGNRRKIIIRTPSPPPQPSILSRFFVEETQPYEDLLAVANADAVDIDRNDDDNESSSSLTVPDTPPSLRQRLVTSMSASKSNAVSVTETPVDTDITPLKTRHMGFIHSLGPLGVCKDVTEKGPKATGETPCDAVKPSSRMDVVCETPLTSHQLTVTTSVCRDASRRPPPSSATLLPAALDTSQLFDWHTTAPPLGVLSAAIRDCAVAAPERCTAVTVSTAPSSHYSVATLHQSDSEQRDNHLPIKCQRQDHAENDTTPWLNASFSKEEAKRRIWSPSTKAADKNDGSDFSNERSTESVSPEIELIPTVRYHHSVSTVQSACSNTSPVKSSNRESLCSKTGVVCEPPLSSMVCSSRLDAGGNRQRSGSPVLDENGDYSRHRSKSTASACVAPASHTSSSVTLIPLSQMLPAEDRAVCSDTNDVEHSRRSSCKDTAVDRDTDCGKAKPSLSKSKKTLQEGRRKSNRLRVPKVTSTFEKYHPPVGCKADDVGLSSQEIEKENCSSQNSVAGSKSLRQDSEEITENSPKAVIMRLSSDRESDPLLARVRRSFIKCARIDADSEQQRLPTAWERQPRSPQRTRRSSDRVKPTDLVVSTKQIEQQSQSGVKGKKRSASSSSSDVDSVERRSQKSRCTVTTRTIAMTSLHTGEQELVRSTISELGDGFTVTDSVVENTTHVVCGGNRRTVKLLMGIARGCWVVSLDWVIKSKAAGCWLSEETFEQADIFPVARTSRMERLSAGDAYRQNLFTSVGNVYVGENSAPPRRELMQLIGLCGGQVTSCLRKAQICIGQRSKKAAVCVTEQWVLDSITQHKCLSFEDYRISG